MSDNDKNTCPVCFTKMRNINKVLTCPECGYKYCDHSRDLQNMFDTTHTHAPNYTTYTNNTTSNTYSANNRTSQTSSRTTQTTTQSTYNAPKTTYTNTSSGQKSTNKNVGKIVKIIVIIYLLAMFCPVGCSVLFATLGVIGEMADSDNTPEIHITSDLVEEDVAVDMLLAEMDADAPIELESKDGEFFPELLKHIFDVDSVDEITYEDISTISYLEIDSYNNDGSVYAYYNYDDGFGNFEYEGSDVNIKDLEVFFALEQLYSPYVKYEDGDLENLRLLTNLTCNNTPAELVDVLDPTQLDDLSLMLPEGTSSLEGLEQFTSLKYLQIDAFDTNITDASVIAELPELFYLDYSDTGSLTDFDFLSKMPNLETLYLYAPGLTDIEFVEDLPVLEDFTLWANSYVTDLSPLDNAKDTLEWLSIAYCPCITDYSVVSELTNLNYLGIENCEFDDLEIAKDLNLLSSLSINETNVTSLAPIKDLPELEYIYAYDTPISDFAGLEDIVYSGYNY